MPVKTKHCLIAAGLMIFGLLMVACATETDPPAEAGRLAETGQPTNLSGSGPFTPVLGGDQAAVGGPQAASITEGPAAEPTIAPVSTPSLPDLGPAPDIMNEVWLNSDRPLNLEQLRGNVVLVEFWTFG
jgi:hypothetical protein